jgi:hypothetical protein
MGEHSEGCILGAAPFFGKCMACTGAAATKIEDSPSAQYSPTDVWSSPTYEQIRLQDRTKSEQDRSFQECLIDLVGLTPLASPVSIGGISITMDTLSPIPPYPASPQWDPETLDQMSNPVHMIPLSPNMANQTAFSTSSTAAPATQDDPPPPLSSSARTSSNTNAEWSRTQVPMTGRRQRWYKSIYPGVDAYSTHNGLT